MRLSIDDLHTFPDAAPQQIDDAFAAFETALERYQTLADQIGDLDVGADLRARTMMFTGFIDLPDDQTPHACLAHAKAIMGKLAASLIWEWGLPIGTSSSRMEVRAEDHSFSASCETTYQVPAR